MSGSSGSREKEGASSGPWASPVRGRHGRLLALAGLALLFLLPGADGHAALGDRVSADIVALYPMNEGTGTTVRDQSNNGFRMDLELSGATSWLAGQNGLTFSGGRALTAGPATKVISALKTSGEATFELWLRPANLTQDGPARFLSIATDTSDRNLNLGQTLSDVQLRLLHTGKDSKGRPFLTTADGFLTTTLIHLVVTFDGSTEAFWVNAVQHPESQSIAGNFSNWDTSNPMAIASEVTTAREWLGDIRLVAIYDRALTPGEILQNFNAGPDVGPLPRVDAGPDKETSPGLPGFTYSTLLEGELLDNGLEDPNTPITTGWTVIDGPGMVTFVDAASPRTMADFSTEGVYTLRLLADNGESIGSDDVVVTVNMVSPTLTATNLEPADGAGGVSPFPTMELDCPSPLPVEGQMMLARDAAFTDIALETDVSPNYICSRTFLAGLPGSGPFWWSGRMRGDDGLWSPWSTPTSFTPLDPAAVTVISLRDGENGYSGTGDADIRGYFGDPNTTLNEWNQGAQDVLRTGRREAGQPDEFYRSLLRFDLTGVAADPALITSAYIELTGWMHGKPQPDFFHGARAFFKMLTPWGEGDTIIDAPEPGEVSWTYSAFPTEWARPGAWGVGTDREGTPLIRGRISSGNIGDKSRWSSAAFVQTVKDWLLDPASNHGLLLVAEDESEQLILNLAARETADVSFHPRLVIEQKTDPCAALSDGEPCDDGNPCTTSDQCLSGSCSGTPEPFGTSCDDGVVCNGTETCDGAGTCMAGSPPPSPQPAAGVGLSPGAGGTEVSWIPSPDASQSNVYRGDVLPAGTWSYAMSCIDADNPGTVTVDPSDPPAGDIYFYLVTGRGSCEESIAHTDSAGSPVSPMTPCP